MCLHFFGFLLLLFPIWKKGKEGNVNERENNWGESVFVFRVVEHEIAGDCLVDLRRDVMLHFTFNRAAVEDEDHRHESDNNYDHSEVESDSITWINYFSVDFFILEVYPFWVGIETRIRSYFEARADELVNRRVGSCISLFIVVLRK